MDVNRWLMLTAVRKHRASPIGATCVLPVLFLHRAPPSVWQLSALPSRSANPVNDGCVAFLHAAGLLREL